MIINKPSTIYLSIAGNPGQIKIFDSRGNLYFERVLADGMKNIKVNIKHPGAYKINVPAKIEKIVNIEIPNLDMLQMPKPERNRYKDFNISYNPGLQGTPAIIYTLEGRIEIGNKLLQYPKPMRVFFLLHEVGHFYYHTEEYCDLFALVHFLKLGYNMSTAMLCLTRVLKRSQANANRVQSLYNYMQKINTKTL